MGSNLGMERDCWSEERESSEHVLECEKVKEIIEKNEDKEWIVSEVREDLMRVTEYIKAYIENEKNKKKRGDVKEPCTSEVIVFASDSTDGADKDSMIQGIGVERNLTVICR